VVGGEADTPMASAHAAAVTSTHVNGHLIGRA
jgi:hypothetical protein